MYMNISPTALYSLVLAGDQLAICSFSATHHPWEAELDAASLSFVPGTRVSDTAYLVLAVLQVDRR